MAGSLPAVLAEVGFSVHFGALAVIVEKVAEVRGRWVFEWIICCAESFFWRSGTGHAKTFISEAKDGLLMRKALHDDNNVVHK